MLRDPSSFKERTTFRDRNDFSIVENGGNSYSSVYSTFFPTKSEEKQRYVVVFSQRPKFSPFKEKHRGQRKKKDDGAQRWSHVGVVAV